MTRPQFSRKGEAPTAKELALMAEAMAERWPASVWMVIAQRLGAVHGAVAAVEALCVVFDELGYLPFSSSGGALLFHLLSKLYERTSATLAAVGSRTGAVHLGRNGREVDQFVHGREVGNEAAELGLALVMNEKVSRGLATPQGRGLDARGDHASHRAASRAQGVREVSRSPLRVLAIGIYPETSVFMRVAAILRGRLFLGAKTGFTSPNVPGSRSDVKISAFNCQL